MNLQEKLQLIQKLSGLTQTQLAQKLGVSFVAFNNWYNGKAKPRQGALNKINTLYEELTGIKTGKITGGLEIKKEMVKKWSKKYPGILKTILKNKDTYEQLQLEMTYHTNSIEGSTLSENETADIIFNNASLSNHSMTEHLEAKNHQTAFNFLFEYLNKKKKINDELILKLHSILLNGIQDSAGNYRNHGVRIVGSHVPTANYLKIPQLMKELILDINGHEKDIIKKVSEIHARFEQVHPFSDGNGRIGRLLMVGMLLTDNYAPAIIKQREKHIYYKTLQKAQLKNESEPLQDFVCDSIINGYLIIEKN